ncbi:MAG: hypothetical protein WHV67_04530 [Thermoanaerobaculia bacterium]
MSISKSILKILILWISFSLFSCREKENFNEKVYHFKSPFFSSKTFPLYPRAEADYNYSRVGVYVFSFIYGWDPKNSIIYSYTTEDHLNDVKSFYEKIISEKLTCEIINHEEFVRNHWDLFQEFEFPNIEGYYEHCTGPNFDLLSPYYHYAKLGWESGTLIVYRP